MISIGTSILFVIIGILFISKNLYSKIIEISNSARGIKTDISTMTLMIGRIAGYLFLIYGIVGVVSDIFVYFMVK